MRTAEDILSEKKREPVWVRKEQTVFEAIELMVEHAIGAILIKEGDRFIGIFTERDLLRNIAVPDFNPKTALVSDYMSSPLLCGTHDMTLLKLHEMFLGLFIRHLMIEKQGRQIGLISSGDVIRASLLEKDQQIMALNEIASWEYYEDWGWDRKKRKKK